MATVYWQGTQAAKKQKERWTLSASSGSGTLRYRVGTSAKHYDVEINHTSGESAVTIAQRLKNAIDAISHPYFDVLTFSGGDGSVSYIEVEANTAGVPFTDSLTEVGSGVISITHTVLQANQSPNDASDSANWSTTPATGDTLVIDGGVDISWGLASIPADAQIIVKPTYTGRIGLNPNVFATTAGGRSYNDDAPEYRNTELYSTYSSTGSSAVIGSRGETPAYERCRIKLSQGTFEIYGTPSSFADDEACYVNTISTKTVEVYDAASRVTIDGASLVTAVNCDDVRINRGSGTAGSFYAENSTVYFGTDAPSTTATVTNAYVYSGAVHFSDKVSVGTLYIYGGTVYFEQNTTSPVTTINHYGGNIDFTGLQETPSSSITLTVYANRDGGKISTGRIAVPLSVSASNGIIIEGGYE